MEGSEERFGIRMVAALADSFEYRRSLGLNVLLMSLDKDKAAV